MPLSAKTHFPAKQRVEFTDIYLIICLWEITVQFVGEKMQFFISDQIFPNHLTLSNMVPGKKNKKEKEKRKSSIQFQINMRWET